MGQLDLADRFEGDRRRLRSVVRPAPGAMGAPRRITLPLVGGVGIGNVMVISVLERRSEIGLRRALGASRRHVAEQFLAEALLLWVLGGVVGTVVGAVATAIYALTQHWSVKIPDEAFYGGIGAAVVIGAVAGLYPSMRAARLSPTEALRTV